jgi:hypothetical protein
MMERAIAGKIPDLTVPAAASQLLTRGEIFQTYLSLCEMIAVSIWRKLD